VFHHSCSACALRKKKIGNVLLSGRLPVRTRRNAGCDPRLDLALNPPKGAIGERHTGREPPCTFQTVPLGTRKPGDTANLAFAQETVEGKHCADRSWFITFSPASLAASHSVANDRASSFREAELVPRWRICFCRVFRVEDFTFGA
jgi:hypothetical protein